MLEYADKPDYAMILGIFERTMKRRGVRESDPLDWEKAGSDSTQSEGLGTAIKNSVPQNNKVIVPDNAENATVDNQENVEPDNMKEVSLIPTCILTLDIKLICIAKSKLKVRMAELEPKRRNRRDSQIQEGMATLNTTEAKNKVVIDNNFNSRNMPQVKNENESPRKEKGINDKEDVEKRNKVDKEGDAVMVVWKDEQNKNNNRESGLLGLEVNATKTEVNEEPVSPSPRAGGRDAWSERGEGEQPSQLSFGVRGTIERRKKVYMGSKSGHIGRYRHSRERNADNSITQMAQMDDENISQAITQAGGCLTLHSKWKSQFDDSEASENETEMKGENLQSPEHKQGESPGGGQGPEPPVVISTARQLELSRSDIIRYVEKLNVECFRITENSGGGGKEGERSNKSSPVHDRKPIHVEISKPFHNPETGAVKNSLHIEVNLPLPPAASAAAKPASASPETEATGKILQLQGSEAGAGGKPCVVIPPPPKEITHFTSNIKFAKMLKIFLEKV